MAKISDVEKENFPGRPVRIYAHKNTKQKLLEDDALAVDHTGRRNVRPAGWSDPPYFGATAPA